VTAKRRGSRGTSSSTAAPTGRGTLTPESEAPVGNLPASLYLDGPPRFWSDRPWPGIGADVDLKAIRANMPLAPIPAEELYREVKDARDGQEAG